MVIKTPFPTIGIRGTSGGGKAGAEGEGNTFTLFADPDGTVGEATVSTQVGTQILNQVNQTTIIKSAFQPPSRPVVMPAEVIQKFYAKAAQSLPTAPADDPENQEGGEIPEGAVEGETENQVEGEGTREGETEQAAECETEAQTEQQLEGEPAFEGEGTLVEGQPEGEAPLGPDGTPDGEPPISEGPGGQQAAPGENSEIEQAGFAAADEAVQQALSEGVSQAEAQQIGQQAALSAAVAEARSQGITDAEINAATAAFDEALANGASLEEAFFAAGNAAETAGDAAAIQFDQQQADLRQATSGPAIGDQQSPEGADPGAEQQGGEN